MATSQETARLWLRDASNVRISNAPINLSAITSLSAQGNKPVATAVSQTPQGVGSVCPSLIYPDQSVIYFELQSLLSNRDTSSNTITLMFRGKRRYRR